jgi:hypothetical protein
MSWIYNILYSKKNQEILELNTKIEELNARIGNLNDVIVNMQNKPKQPDKLGTIKIQELHNKLLEELNCEIFLSDMVYSLTSKEEAEKYSNETSIRYMQWQEEKFDCDEFSFALMGYWNEGLEQFAFGIAWSKTHAFNILIDNNKQIWIIEPQSNQFFKLEEIKSNKLYWPLRVAII